MNHKHMIVVVGLLAMASLSGCAWLESHQAQIGKTAQIVGARAGEIALNVVLESAVSQLDRDKKQDYLDGLAEAFRSHELDFVNADDMKAIVAAWTPDKPHWQELGTRFADLWAQYHPKSREEVAVFLEAYAKALNDPGSAAASAPPGSAVAALEAIPRIQRLCAEDDSR